MRSNNERNHLTDDEFSELVAGEEPDPGIRAHLAMCEHCRLEVEAVRSSVHNFNRFSMTWAESEAPRRVRTPPRWMLGLASRPSWNLGLAGTAIACLLVFGLDRSFQLTPTPETIPQAVTAPSSVELAQDNQLLESINQELSAEAELTIPVAELHVMAHRAGSRHSIRPVAN